MRLCPHSPRAARTLRSTSSDWEGFDRACNATFRSSTAILWPWRRATLLALKHWPPSSAAKWSLAANDNLDCGGSTPLWILDFGYCRLRTGVLPLLKKPKRCRATAVQRSQLYFLRGTGAANHRWLLPRVVDPADHHFIPSLVTPVNLFRGVGVGPVGLRVVEVGSAMN